MGLPIQKPKEDLEQIPEGPQKQAATAAIEKKEASVEKESQAAVRLMTNTDKTPEKSEICRFSDMQNSYISKRFSYLQ